VTDGATPHPARVLADAWIAQGIASAAATAHARAVADAGPMGAPCDPAPRPPSCGVTSAPVPRDPPGMSHRVPPASIEPGAWSPDPLVVAMFERATVAARPMGPMPPTRYHGRPGPRPVEVAPPPVVPELVPGADAAARRGTIDRAAVLIGELGALLARATPEVAARARTAIARLTPAK